MLVLVPTPLNQFHDLHPDAKARLENLDESKDIVVVEEHKLARRRWVRWGLEREWIEKFVLYNEHTRQKLKFELLKELKRGKRIYLMSDGGLPAFCDPGVNLVRLCHENNIPVSSTSFSNSIALSVSLSGMDLSEFTFAGFLPQKGPEREKRWKDLLSASKAFIIMDTPYRLKKVLEDVKKFQIKREIFLGIDLNFESELVVQGNVSKVLRRLEKEDSLKREFIMIIGRK